MTTLHGELTADRKSIMVMSRAIYHDELTYLARQLRTLTPLLKPSTPPGAIVVPATWPAVVQLANVMPGNWRPGVELRQWIDHQVRVRKPSGPSWLRCPVPDGLEPRPYQVDGARLIAATGKAVINDEPGTGKTITAILGLLERWEATQSVFPAVVVAPASVVDSWVDAWRLWAPNWHTVAFRGSPALRTTLVGTADVYVTSYDTARVDIATKLARAQYLLKIDPRSVVIDEHHMIKSHRAARTIAVRRLARDAGNIVALSGTPITHHPADLWPTLACLEPNAWPSRERWVGRYCLTSQSDYGEEILGLNPGTEDELRRCLLGQQRRVSKADVLAQLPPKIYSVRTVSLPPAYRRAYDQMQARMLAELPDGTELSVMTVLAQMTRLSQLASAAADVTTVVGTNDAGDEVEHVTVRLMAPSWKVDALLEVLEERPSEPVVVFAPSKQLIEIAGEAAVSAGYTTGYIVGGQSARARTDTVQRFQHGQIDVVCATTAAGGVGLTLTAARTVIFLQRPWSLVESLQAEDRCHRIGSERHDSIEIIDIIAADTIDTRVRAALRAKGQQLADLVQDPRIVAELLGGTHVTRKAA